MTQTRDGLTEQEREVMDALAIAWNGYAALEMQHPSELADFADGIHMCQKEFSNEDPKKRLSSCLPNHNKKGEL